MAKSTLGSQAEAAAALDAAVRQWRSAKKSERAARDALAAVVTEIVRNGLMTESKIAKVTQIPRMTIRKMLGKA